MQEKKELMFYYGSQGYLVCLVFLFTNLFGTVPTRTYAAYWMIHFNKKAARKKGV